MVGGCAPSPLLIPICASGKDQERVMLRRRGKKNPLQIRFNCEIKRIEKYLLHHKRLSDFNTQHGIQERFFSQNKGEMVKKRLILHRNLNHGGSERGVRRLSSFMDVHALERRLTNWKKEGREGNGNERGSIIDQIVVGEG